jgi:3'-phosphoadenosine 5'-phosphosulfate sulfotransferase (PAPS reductase)/FAD synthetase
MHIVSFSGGKDSTAMLLMMIEKGMPIDRVICVDTTKEFPEMYRHIEKVKEYIAPLEIEVVKIDFDYWFSEHVKTRGKNKGKKGYGWADFRVRWCTSLKQEAVANIISGGEHNSRSRSRNIIPSDVIEYHGIAYDEIHRVDRNSGRNIRYPLVEWKITEKEALEYCYAKGFDWEGLYKHFDRISCFCCPLSSIGDLRYTYNHKPELWGRIAEMDKLSYRDFRLDYTIQELEDKFDEENRQMKLL